MFMWCYSLLTDTAPTYDWVNGTNYEHQNLGEIFKPIIKLIIKIFNKTSVKNKKYKKEKKK